MGSVYGKNIKLSLFGESHGKAVGIVVDGLPSGVFVDEAFIADEMARRSPVGKKHVTGRQEQDEVRIISGVYRNKTSGTPLTALIENTDIRSEDYKAVQNIPRPGHGDFTAHIRYHGYNDPRGGGHGSGRLTAPLVFAGAVCKLVIRQYYSGIGFESKLISVGGTDDPDGFMREVERAAKVGDSVGGVVEGCISGLPAGLGAPFFDTVESRLSALLYAIPGVKGVAFGDGFAMASAKGSEMNDPILMSEKGIVTATNHNGGINGGITNGMPVVVQVVFKPTPSIALPQRSVNMETKEAVTLSVTGRHDPCIALRAIPVVESALAIVALDLLLESP